MARDVIAAAAIGIALVFGIDGLDSRVNMETSPIDNQAEYVDPDGFRELQRSYLDMCEQYHNSTGDYLERLKALREENLRLKEELYHQSFQIIEQRRIANKK